MFVAFPARRDEHLNRIGTPFVVVGKGRKVRRREIEAGCDLVVGVDARATSIDQARLVFDASQVRIGGTIR